jgi:diguanylate cyclase (GGDEF)-like protein/PAS domain S-box-containing protein
MTRRRSFRPFAVRGRSATIAIVVLFAVVSGASAALSIWTTGRSSGKAAVIEVAARQRMLSERYVADVLLAQSGRSADPAVVGDLLGESAHALIDGGAVPAAPGDDDETTVAGTNDPVVRAQLEQEERLVDDLTRTGDAILAHQSVTDVRLTAGEHMGGIRDGVQRLRVLAALTSNVSLNAARTIAQETDGGINRLIALEVALGVGGLAVALLLGWALITITRRQTVAFRSLVTASTDLVLVFGDGGCRYTSRSVATLLGKNEAELLGDGFARCVHADDLASFNLARRDGRPNEIVFRVRNTAGTVRHLEAHLTDLRSDSNVRGVVMNARDVTERLELERELTRQGKQDGFSRQLVDAFEMADVEDSALRIVERGMAMIDAEAPMELLLADSSRSQLYQGATSPTAGAPGCPVDSPFSCVAIRRGNPVVFPTSRALNACPKLWSRPGGACSATCVPVTFMGRTLGVLHVTGPDEQPPAPDEVAQLTALATHAGTRIGTVRAFERSQLQASTDGLTGLINRRTFESEVRELVRGKQSFALALGDLDHFKQLNDTHGHEAGDRALRVFARVLRETMRDHDLVARYGGEEFAFALPGLDEERAASVLDRVRAALAVACNGGPLFTASFGITDSSRGASLDELMRIADDGLYRSKETGRDRATIGDPSAAAAQEGRALRAVTGDAETVPLFRHNRPAMHTAAHEDEPRASGLEIR